jgi:molybdopterin-guanine dinucleotide biosynthesis adapter protein
MMKVLHIVGRKNHGKTKLIVELVEELTKRGHSVGTIKHCAHQHDIDTPGKDSYVHREAGATPVAVVTPDLVAVYAQRQDGEEAYGQFRGAFDHCDLVLIEGDASGPGPKFEVWRAGNETAPIASEREGISGIVTDDAVDLGLPVWPRNDVSGLADQVMAHLGEV